MTNKELYNEFASNLKKYTDQQLIERFNHERKGRGWVNAKAVFMEALRNEFYSRNIDISAIANASGGFIFRKEIVLIDKTIEPLNEN